MSSTAMIRDLVDGRWGAFSSHADGFHLAKDRYAAFSDHRITVLIEDIGQVVGKLLVMHNGDTEPAEQWVSLPEAIYQGLSATK